MRRMVRSLRVLVEQALRARTLAVLVLFAAVSAGLLWWARGLPQYRQNFALNLGADLVGAFLVIFAVTPMVRRAQQGGVREHRRLYFGWYVDRVLSATTDVRILHTFSRLFAQPYDRRFFRAAGGLLRRHGRIQILLLDPDSPAAALRTAELRGHTDVGREVRRNLHTLDEYRRGLDLDLRRHFEVRLYDALPSVAIYQWDDRLLAAFLPLGRLSGDDVQLEVSVESPLGTFVAERFEELWRNSSPLEDYMTLRLSIGDGSGRTEYACRFVTLEGVRYLADPEVAAHLARSHADAVSVTVDHASNRAYVLEHVAADSPVAAELGPRFFDKYDRREATFLRLTPGPA